MTLERTITRYGAFYRGWCQAFGEHEVLSDPELEVTWILGEERVGVILQPRLLRALTHELQHEGIAVPTITLAHDFLEVGDTRHPLPPHSPEGIKQLTRLLELHPDIHLFLTYHLFYESGTRILTFSSKRPLPLVYKTLGPLHLTLT